MASAYKSNCLICGEEIIYSEKMQPVVCSICGKPFESAGICKAGHFVCDTCHSRRAREEILNTCLHTKRRDAVDIARQLMELPWVHMHGPEHHCLTAAALITAYYNCGYMDDGMTLEEALKEAMKRGALVPGGFCGFWGCCGAAVGAGIFASLVTGTSPLSRECWGEANLLTARALERIARIGGPRCCKRDSFLAIFAAADFSKEKWGRQLTERTSMVCSFYKNNRECLGKACPFNGNGGEI